MSASEIIGSLEKMNKELSKPTRSSLNRIGFLKSDPAKPASEKLARVYRMQDHMIGLLERKIGSHGDKLTGLEVSAMTQALIELGKALEDRE